MAVKVIGAGLAGCEAAWQLANAGIETELYEMKPLKYTPAHHYEGMAELVCSNSLKAARVDSACGLLKEEMRRLGSLIVPCAEATSVEAGGALAVDRKKFSDLVTEKIDGGGQADLVDPASVEGVIDAPVAKRDGLAGILPAQFHRMHL